MSDDQTDRIACATYTHARRHPLVIGQIGGWTPPFQLSVAQIIVLLASVLTMAQMWRWWGAFLPRWFAVLFIIGIPAILTWSVRRARVEGRSLMRAAVGWLNLLMMPRPGKAGGRPYREGRPVFLGLRMFVAPGERAS